MDTLALSTLTTAEAAERIARRQVSSVDLVAACLGRIEALEPRLNCFITVCREEALAAAREADDAQAGGRQQTRLDLTRAHGDPRCSERAPRPPP